PFRDADRLVRMALRSPGSRGGGYTIFGSVSPAVLAAWRQSPIFTDVQAAHGDTSVVGVSNELAPVERDVAFATPRLFPMLGVVPLRGRLYSDDEGRENADIALVSAQFWRKVLANDPGVIGRSIRIDGTAVTIVGVMPESFRFPDWKTEIWRPINYDVRPASQARQDPTPYARLAADVPQADLLAQASSLAQNADPAMAKNLAVIQPIAGLRSGTYLDRATPFLAGGVVLVFLVLCANVATLLLAQLSNRAREFGMCAALGASRPRLMRQALTESLILGGAGVAAGIAAAWLLVTLTRRWLPNAFLLQTLNPIDLDPRALAVASGVGIAAAIAAGLLPAWIGTRVSATHASRAESRAATEPRAARIFTRVMLVGEIALTCTLLVGTALLVLSFVRLSSVDRGLDTRGLISAWVSLARTETAQATVEETLRAMPGIGQVVASEGVPPDGSAIHFGDGWMPDTPGSPNLTLTANSYGVGPDFFDVYRIPLVRGRMFEANEDPAHVIVGEQIAAILWPDLDPIGRSFALGKQRFTVVGLVKEIRHPSLDPLNDVPEFYRYRAPGSRAGRITMRCIGRCPEIAQVRQTLAALPDVRSIYGLGPIEDAYTDEIARPKAAAVLALVFAGIAVVAAGGGLFGVLSYAVGRRRREFGIRASLGARPAELSRLVLGEGARLAIAGVVLGSLAAWGLARVLSAVVYDVTIGEPLIWTGVATIVAATTIAACWAPARRASRVDPVELLRDA
ncbi:MAG TPA: FtsX-like permease family protein, partial [Vicinamibacterales bacterium]|nr:FtsX-like permease family protein [Vicinamibacterales bacterium]